MIFRKRKQKATGGLTFIVIMTLMTASLTYVVNLSAMDVSQSLANNCAYQVAYRAAVNLYNNSNSTSTYSNVKLENGAEYNLTNEYKELIKGCYGGWLRRQDDSLTAYWNRSTRELILRNNGEGFSTIWGNNYVKPKTQYIVIEN